jgi:tRNA G18 (ribose-2'-O)-methylase SpoU
VGPLVEISDPADPRLSDYRALTDVALRTRFEPPHGLFIAEGELVIRRAVQAGYRLRSILTTPKWLDRLSGLDRPAAFDQPANLARPEEVPTFVGPPALLETVTGFHVHRGALASAHRRPLPAPADLLATARRVVVLEDVNTHTNIGAIFRAVAGLGMDAVLLSPRCADPLYRRSVRVSMGAVVAVPYARFESWPAGLADLRAARFRLVALTPAADALPLDRLQLGPQDAVALLLGAEGPGLSAGALTAADQLVRIPLTGGVDSLNVAAAAAVACYVVGRR